MTVWLRARMTHDAEAGDKQPRTPRCGREVGAVAESFEDQMVGSASFNGLTSNCACFTFLQSFSKSMLDVGVFWKHLNAPTGKSFQNTPCIIEPFNDWGNNKAG